MHKIKKWDSVSPEFKVRIDGGSFPEYFHVRYVGKAHSFLKPELPMDYMIANEFICYELAGLIKGINVPQHFLDSYEGELHFFTRDIDPRPDTELSIYYAWKGDYDSVNADDVHLAFTFNLWVINCDASAGRNLLIIDGKLILMDFACALLGTVKDNWKENFELYKNDKVRNKNIFYSWIEFDLEKFKVASKKIASIPDNEIEFVLKEAVRLKLITEEESRGTKDFLIDRKTKLLEVI